MKSAGWPLLWRGGVAEKGPGIPWHEGGILVPPHLFLLYRSGLCGAYHDTRPRYGSRAAAAFAEKGVDPSNQQQLVWQRETDRVGGQTMRIKGKTEEGFGGGL